MKFFLSGVCLFLTFAAGIAFAERIPDRIAQNVESATFDLLINGHLTGNGWFATPDGLGITAAHLLRTAGRIEVITRDHGRLPARLVATDLPHDLALLRIARPAGFFSYLSPAPALPGTGEDVFAYGSLLYRRNLFLGGTVARPRTTFEWNGPNRCYSEVFLVAATTAKGFSGAPWLDFKGRVIGIQSGMLTWRNGLAGMAFVVPAAAAQKLLSVRRARPTSCLGAQLADIWNTTGPRTQGVTITRVLQGSAASLAGLRAGDLILALNGRTIEDRTSLIRAVRALPPGRPVRLRFQRGRDPAREVSLELQPCGQF